MKFEQTTYDTIEQKLKIPEESSENFQLNHSTPSQSRNLNLFDNKSNDASYSTKNFKKNKQVFNKYNFYPDTISEYSAKTPSCMSSSKKNKITKSLNNCKELLRAGIEMKASVELLKKKSFETSNKISFASQSIQGAPLFKKAISNKKSPKLHKVSYGKLHAKRKQQIKSGHGSHRHKYNKSYGGGIKKYSNASKGLKKTKANYSVYLSNNQNSIAPEMNILERLHTDKEYMKIKKTSMNYATADNISRTSDK